MNIRNDIIPVCTIIGHVDVGKTKLLDHMRSTKTIEASGITQQIGSTLYSRSRLLELVGPKLEDKLNLESLLMIDTPGHECFDMIRYIGMLVSDVVILVVDFIKGVEKEAIKSIEFLNSNNKNFIIVMNKMDRIYGWNNNSNNDHNHSSLKDAFSRQNKNTIDLFNKYIDNTKLTLAENCINGELYYKNKSPDDTHYIVPISAETGEGIPDLVMLISKLAEKEYLKKIESDKIYGYILDSHYDSIYGKYFVCLHKNGNLKRGDKIIINNNQYLIKNILLNNDNTEIKDKHRFKRVNKLTNTTGFGLILDSVNESNILDIEIGSFYYNGYIPNLNKLNKKLDLDKYIDHSKPGISIVAPSYIILDGFIQMLQSSNKYTVENIEIGNIDKKTIMKSSKWIMNAGTKRDLIEMSKYSCILYFNPSLEEINKDIIKLANEMKVNIIHSNTVYNLVEKYEEYIENIDQKLENMDKLGEMIKLEIIPEYIFRKSNPVVLGVKVKSGIIRNRSKIKYVNDQGEIKILGTLIGIQKDKESINMVEEGEEVCIKIDTKLTYDKDFTSKNVLFILQKN